MGTPAPGPPELLSKLPFCSVSDSNVSKGLPTRRTQGSADFWGWGWGWGWGLGLGPLLDTPSYSEGSRTSKKWIWIQSSSKSQGFQEGSNRTLYQGLYPRSTDLGTGVE